MRLVVVSGLSGSGKSSTLDLLEDLGFYCVDNLPSRLLPQLVEHAHTQDQRLLAVGIDSRNNAADLAEFGDIYDAVCTQVRAVEIIYLYAHDDILLNRFQATRRKHPLSDSTHSIVEALQLEKFLLEPIASRAALQIDTTTKSVHDFRNQLRVHFSDDSEKSRWITLKSFGFKRGALTDADMVFDARSLPNPHWEAHLRKLNGTDLAIRQYLDGNPDVELLYADILHFLETWIPKLLASDRNYITIGIGCTGGQHRSVYLVERLASGLSKQFSNIQVRHREMPHEGLPDAQPRPSS